MMEKSKIGSCFSIFIDICVILATSSLAGIGMFIFSNSFIVSYMLCSLVSMYMVLNYTHLEMLRHRLEVRNARR